MNLYDHLIGRRIKLESWDTDLIWFRVDSIQKVGKRKYEYEFSGIDNLGDATPVTMNARNKDELIILIDFEQEIDML